MDQSNVETIQTNSTYKQLAKSPPLEMLNKDIFSLLFSYLSIQDRFASFPVLSKVTSKLLIEACPRNEKIWFAIGDCAKVIKPTTFFRPIRPDENGQCMHNVISTQSCYSCHQLREIRDVNGRCAHDIDRMDLCEHCCIFHVQRNQSIRPFVIYASHIEAHFDEYDESNSAHRSMIDIMTEAIKGPALHSLSITETLYGQDCGYEWNSRKTHSPIATAISALHKQSNIQSLTLKTMRRKEWSYGKSKDVSALYKQSNWQLLSALVHLTSINVVMEFDEMHHQLRNEIFVSLPMSITSLTVSDPVVLVGELEPIHTLLNDSNFLPHLQSLSLPRLWFGQTDPVESLALTTMSATGLLRPIKCLRSVYASVSQFPHLFLIQSLQSLNLKCFITNTTARHPFETAPLLPYLESVSLHFQSRQHYSVDQWHTLWTYACGWLARCQNTLKQVTLISNSREETGLPVQSFLSLGQCHMLEKLTVLWTHNQSVVWPTAELYQLSLPASCWTNMHTLDLKDMSYLDEESLICWIKAAPNVSNLLVYTECVPWLWLDQYTPKLINLSLRCDCYKQSSTMDMPTKVVASLQYLALSYGREFDVVDWLLDNREVLIGSPLRSIEFTGRVEHAQVLYYERLNKKDFRFLELCSFTERREMIHLSDMVLSDYSYLLPDFCFRMGSVDGYENGRIAFFEALTQLYDNRAKHAQCVVL